MTAALQLSSVQHRGARRRGFDFDPSATQYIDFGYIPALAWDRTQPFTIAAWFKRVTPHPSFAFIVGTKQSNRGWSFGFDNASGQIDFAILGSGGNLVARAGGASAADTWHFGAVSYPGTSNAFDCRMVVNGVRVNPSSFSNTLSGTSVSAGPVRIAASDGALGLFRGSIGPVAIWDSALTQEQMMDLYVRENWLDAWGPPTFYALPDADSVASVSGSYKEYASGNNGTPINTGSARAKPIYPHEVVRSVGASVTSPAIQSGGSGGTSLTKSTTSPATVRGYTGYETGHRFAGGSRFWRSGSNQGPRSTFVGAAYTFECLSFLEGTTGGDQIIFRIAGNGETEATNVVFQLQVTSTGELALFWEYGAGVNVSLPSGFTMPLNRWAHVAVVGVEDGADRDVSIYVEGALVAQVSGTKASGGTSFETQIAADAFAPGAFWNGALSHLRVSDVARSPGEILAASTNPALIAPDANTVELWRLQDR